MGQSTILFIDDNEHQHKLIECYSQTLDDVDVRHARSLESIIDNVERERFDVIFLDSRLPPHSDYRETAPKIRACGYDGKIIVISADINDPIFSKFDEFGVDDCLDKSDITLRNYQDIVSQYL